MILLFCGRDSCAYFLGILLVSRPGNLLAGGFILRAAVVSPDVVAVRDDSLHRCRVYVFVCGGFAVLATSVAADQNMASVKEVIVPFP